MWGHGQKDFAKCSPIERNKERHRIMNQESKHKLIDEYSHKARNVVPDKYGCALREATKEDWDGIIYWSKKIHEVSNLPEDCTK